MVAILALLLPPSLALATVADPQVLTYTGDIASGAQFDLYPVNLRQGDSVVATLVCNFDGVSRPLDPVLSAVLPGGDSSDTIFADFYNDDGFGQDDDPNGVDCDTFDSSRLIFFATAGGDWVFRVDGFGSTTGPYTLTITIEHARAGAPALGALGLGLLAALLGAGAALRLRRRP